MPALNEHTVASYDEELTGLAAQISDMGGMVEVAVADATRALLKLDHELARSISRICSWNCCRPSPPGIS